MMNKKLAGALLAALVSLSPGKVWAQLSSNPDKFLGNITTRGQVDYGNEKFYQLWNQITPENESKWQSVQGWNRNSYSWDGCDRSYNYAKKYGFPFKFHTLVWGSQYPSWMDNLSTSEQYKAIVAWMDAAQKRYPDLQMIDVVNEAIAGHAPAPFKDALGGDGVTGYDWIVKAFEMAHERWPDAILIYNDYNTFQWNTDQFIDLVTTLRNAGAPIDAYGCQSHDLNDCNLTTFKNSMTKIQNALKMPMYITEYDIDKADDQQQLTRYKEQIPVMWEADYCAGVTLWGYIHGCTWVDNSGIIKNGKDRPAMEWLREYMQSDKAKQAKSPFPGMVKEASVYVKPSALGVTIEEPMSIEVRARLKTKTIDHVDLYVGTALVATMTEAPYTAEYVPEKTGKYTLKAVVTATDGTTYERLSGFTANKPRTPYKGGTTLPGTLEAENFDSGGEGMTFHDSDTKNEGTTAYRNDGGGVDIIQTPTGYGIGYTAVGEWLEYTVDVTEAGNYSYKATASSGLTGSGFTLSLVDNNGLTQLCKVNVPQTGNNDWGTYTTIEGKLSQPLEAGTQRLRLTITGAYCNIDKIVLECTSSTGIVDVRGDDDGASAGYSLTGQKVSADYRGIIIRNGKKVLKK